jgi:hypothetical protein
MTSECLQQEIQTLTNQKAETLLKLRELEEQVSNGKKLLDGIDGALIILSKLLKEEETVKTDE